MNDRPTVLCPIDFSDASRAALFHARAIAQHFEGRLIVLTVEDPLLSEAVDLSLGDGWHPEDTRRELARFDGDALPAVFASGNAYPDALSAGSLAASLGAPLMLVPPTNELPDGSVREDG